MRNRIAMAIWLLFVSSGGVGWADPVENRLGLSFGENEWLSCADPTFFTPQTVYIILVRPNFAALHGWEAGVHATEEDFIVLSSEVYGGGTNSGSKTEFVVTYDEPIVTEAVLVLASFEVLPVAWEYCMFLTGVSNPSLADPNPLVWPAPGLPTPVLTTDFYGDGIEAAISNCVRTPEDTSPPPCSGAVHLHVESWGGLKATYR